MMDAKKLSECGAKYVIEDKGPDDRYEVEIEPGEYLVVCVGFTAGKPGAKFTHPNIAATEKEVHEYKHYRSSGSKFWTARAGVNHYLVIPRTAVTLMPEKGMSYIKAEINGVKVTFNVSGGGGGGVWTDYLRMHTSTLVNHPLRDLKKMCEVAIRGTTLEPIKVKPMELSEEVWWNQLMAKASPRIKEKVAKMVEAGKNPVVRLMSGYTFDKGEAIEVSRRSRKHRTSETSYTLEYDGSPKSITVVAGFGRYRVKMTQIDWYATAKENGVAL